MEVDFFSPGLRDSSRHQKGAVRVIDRAVTHPRLNRIVRCPLVFDAPFLPPRWCPIERDVNEDLWAWCDALLPGVPLDLAEWVGSDGRQPLHILVISFPRSDRDPVVLAHKIEDITRCHLADAFAMGVIG